MTLVNTLLEPIRAEYLQRLDKYENRGSKYGALSQFMRDTEADNSILSDDAKAKITGSFGNTVDIPVVDYKDVTIGNTRSCLIADDENTSQLFAVTFTTYVFGFTMTPAQHYQNSIDYQNDFTLKMRMALNSFQIAVENQCIAQLESDKNAFFPTDVTNYYPAVGDALQVPQAEKEDFYNQLQSIYGTMDYDTDNIQVISNWAEAANVRRYFAQGAENGINEAFQLGPYEWDQTNRVTNNLGVQSTLYSYPKGSIAIWNRNDADAVLGSTIGSADSPVKQWAEVPVVLDNGMTMNMASYYTQDCADKSALGGGASERSHVESFEFSTDIFTVTAYNSDRVNRYSPVVKTEILS